MKIEHINNQKKPQELLPQIIDRIFSVCKSDPSFKLKDELEIVENKILIIQRKIQRQDELLKQSEELRKDLIQRMKIMDEHNHRKQTELLELIGSEL